MPGPSADYCKAELERIMRESVHCAIGLREVLTAERQALEHQDTGALNQAAIDKGASIGRLEQLETERADLSRSCGFGSAPEEMKPLLTWCDEDSVVENIWRHFLEVAMTCNELNATNGSIIRLRRSQILNALAILRGGETEPDLYGNDGRDTGGKTSRPLAEA